jgi:glutaredoxin
MLLCALLCLSAYQPMIASAADAKDTTRCLAVEFYIDGSDPAQLDVAAELEELTEKQPGIRLRVMDVEQFPAHQKRLAQLCRHFELREQTPLLYACGQTSVGAADARQWQQRLNALRTLTVYVRAGCPRCAKAKEYLPTLAKQHPGLIVELRDIASDRLAAQDLQAVTTRHRVTAVSVPVFHLCNQVVVGFSDAQTSGARLEAILKTWTKPCEAESQKSSQRERPFATLLAQANVLKMLTTGVLISEEPAGDDDALPLPDLPLPVESELPLESTTESAVENVIELPFFGPVSVEAVGMPLFTIAVGLIDGFNPCAMWVLMFLLSVLVNVHSRWKMLAVAGTFVGISAAVYFAFMAAWISIFQFIGLTRIVQVALAVLAIVIGSIHVKDFFAFHQGVSLSIPESAKPQIYQRVRRIVSAQNLTGAIVGAAVLAVLVNMVELLCTAGLPALYTQILTAQQLPLWANYAYLALYNLAYMFDDGLMVAVVVITLGQRKMQEQQGRWLKLVSGSAILALGLIILIQPQWLGM